MKALEWETIEYGADASAEGKHKALIILGHIPSEQAGMEDCAVWLKGFVTEVPVRVHCHGGAFLAGEVTAGGVPARAIAGNHGGFPFVSRGMIRIQGRRVSIGLALASLCCAYASPAADRITQTIDNRRVTLAGHVSPRITAAVDQGPVDPGHAASVCDGGAESTRRHSKPIWSGCRQSSRMQVRANYHAWLTPEQYADRFGLRRPT